MYIPLYNKSNYSLLESMLLIDDILEYALNNKLDSIALCDNNMYGVMEFIKKSSKLNINPIVGIDIKIDDNNILLYCKNYDGYKNLMIISSLYSKNEVDIDVLNRYKNDLICILPFKNISFYNNIVGVYDDIYIGVNNIYDEDESYKISDKVVYLNMCLYNNSEDSKYIKYLYLMKNNLTVNDNIDINFDNCELYNNNINVSDNCLNNSIEIANKCRLVLPKSDILLPVYDVDNSFDYLKSLSIKGLNKRLNNQVSNIYKDRLLYELDIINNMGFSNYFLVVYDYIKWAKKNNILVGPGRGSAVGSLVAYSLGIIDINPIEYDLLFERFLNPQRQSMPDIDTDFPDTRRVDVINYVREKYGENCISGIVTFNTLGVKQVIRDVSRTLNIPLYKVDGLCKLIPNGNKDSLIDLYKNNEIFRIRVQSDITLSNMFDIAKKFEGFPRHISSHASGIIMCGDELYNHVPLIMDDELNLTAYSMEYLEELGLLKMDFLGIKNLTIISNIIDKIKKIYDINIDFSKIPLDDVDVFHEFEIANTDGVFQFESSGMKNFLKKLKVSSFDDIIAAIALFRPGPSQFIDSYIRRKEGLEKVEYLDSCLEPILNKTYGILIYQEQIMRVASVYAGYSLAEADILRRAISKKKSELLKAQEDTFISKSISMGRNREQAKKLFDIILSFAGYGFNNSHSVAYSIIAYKMAYLKLYFPSIFYSEVLTSPAGTSNSFNDYIKSAKANNIKIIKPNINISTMEFIPGKDYIIYPLSSIVGLNKMNVSKIIEDRNINGKYLDIYDCICRLFKIGISKDEINVLIMSGCLDDFKYTKATLIYNLEALYNYAELESDIDVEIEKPSIIFQEEYSNIYLLEEEKRLFGLYLTYHPTSLYLGKYNNIVSLNMNNNYFNKVVDNIILVDKIKEINTKKGEKMAFVSGSDETGNYEYVLFPKVYLDFEVLSSHIYIVRGRIERRNSDYQMIVSNIKRLDNEE